MTPAASFRASQAFNRASWVQPTAQPLLSFITRSETTDTEALPPLPWLDAIPKVAVSMDGETSVNGQDFLTFEDPIVRLSDVRAALAQQQVPAAPQAAQAQPPCTS